ncbi:MAG: ribose transport system ATP-binding protein [Thermomicrobiales bacterium]|jgi:ribose transport system ATP-binding protein|nr:ribose transport system ATP-binding protein [Thermomicrobiales bacterium]
MLNPAEFDASRPLASTSSSSPPAPVLELRGVSKRFPGVVALDDVSFDLRPGEVHVLVGENGAGKSTLVKILSGIYQPDAGEFLLDGKPVVLRDPHSAQQLGISTVHQELNLIPHLDVGRNIFLGREPMRGAGVIDWARLYRDARVPLAALGIDLDPRTQVRRIGVAMQQMTEIAKALVAQARVLILDEPTAAITAEEAEQLFRIVERLRAQGTGIILISHHLEDATRVGDRVTVFRDGRWVATKPMAETSPRDMIRLMVGRELTQQYPKQTPTYGRVALKVEGINRRGVLHDVSFEVRRGELLGLAGLVGAGRTELARAIFGIDRIDAGRIEVDGTSVRIHGPGTAIKNRIALLPEDRKQHGLVLPLTVADNIVMAAPDKMPAPPGLAPPGRRMRAAQRFVEALRIRTPSTRQKVLFLSGGNQQKVVLAKWLLTEADIFIFDEPTRGIDVGAKVEVYRLMNDLLARGAAIVMISSELSEVLGMSDRILVMRGGRIVAELDGPTATQEQVMTYAAAPVDDEAVA